MTIPELAQCVETNPRRIYDLVKNQILPRSIIERRRPAKGRSHKYTISEKAPDYLIAFFALWDVGLLEEEIPKVLEKVDMEELKQALHSLPYPQFIQFLYEKNIKVTPWTYL